MPRQIRLNLNLQTAGRHDAAWKTLEHTERLGNDAEHHVQVARLAEKGKLDAVFLADGHGPLSQEASRRPWRGLKPTVLAATIAGQTERIGLVNEFVEIVTSLWDSFPQSAIADDKERDIYVDASKTVPVGQSGRVPYLPGSTLPVPSGYAGRPVRFQAGASDHSRAFGAKWADALFTGQRTKGLARQFAKHVKGAAAAHGRDPEKLVILPGLFVILGNEAQAQVRKDELDALLDADYLLDKLAEQLGIPASELSLDEEPPYAWLAAAPPDTSLQARHREQLLTEARTRGLTVRQLLINNLSGEHRILVGTPEQVADDVIEWVDDGASDGFNINIDVQIEGLERFIDGTDAELQRRGPFRQDYEYETFRENLGVACPSAIPPSKGTSMTPVPDRPRFRLGFLTHVQGRGDLASTYRNAQELFVVADELGFDVGWVAQHHAPLGGGGLPWPWTFLAHAAARTKRIKLSTAITILPLENPVRLAEDLSVVDTLSGGRVEIGVGSGASEVEYSAFGADVARKRELTSEGLEVLRGALAGQEIGPQGFKVQPPPGDWSERIWQGVFSAPGAQYAATAGSNLLLNRAAYGYNEPTDEVQRPWADAFLTAWSLPRAPRIGLSRFVFPAKDKKTALDQIAADVHAAAQKLALRGAFPDGIGQAEALRRFHCFYGHPDEVIEGLGKEKVLPVATDLITQFNPAIPDHDAAIRALELIATEVAPALGWKPATQDSPVPAGGRH